MMMGRDEASKDQAITEISNVNPVGDARGKVGGGSPKSAGFVFCRPRMSVQDFTTTCPIVFCFFWVNPVRPTDRPRSQSARLPLFKHNFLQPPLLLVHCQTFELYLLSPDALKPKLFPFRFFFSTSEDVSASISRSDSEDFSSSWSSNLNRLVDTLALISVSAFFSHVY